MYNTAQHSNREKRALHHNDWCSFHGKGNSIYIIHQYEPGLSHEALQRMIDQLGDRVYVDELRKAAKMKLIENGDYPYVGARHFTYLVDVEWI